MMKPWFSAFGILVILTAFIFPAQGKDEIKTLAIGSKAPDFNLPGIDGKQHRLADYAKAKVLGIVFLCNHCPSSQGAESRVKALLEAYGDKGFELVAISPNDPESLRLNELGYSVYSDTYEEMKLHAEKYEWSWPYLYDGETQATAKAYGATATPHLFLFDEERILRYVGRIDDSKFGDPATITKRNAHEAIGEMLAGKEVSEPVTRAHGCSTKWADKRHLVEKYNENFQAKEVTVEKIDQAGLRVLRANETDKYRLVNLWATWCGPCLAEMPHLVEIGRQFETRGLELITISTDDVSAYDRVTKLAQRFHAAMPDLTAASVAEEGRKTNNYLYQGSSDSLADVVDKEWQGALPHTLLIAPGGEVVARFSGEIDPAEVREVIVNRLGRWYSPK